MVFPFSYTQEGLVKRAAKAKALGGSKGMLPQKTFLFRASEMPFSMFSTRGKFHKSKHNRTLTIQYLCCLFINLLYYCTILEECIIN